MKKLLTYFGFDKLKTAKKTLKDNGGLLNSLYIIWRTDNLKCGDLVGTDKYGNNYYENNSYMYGKNRWVIYNDKSFFEYDASQVPPEWHNWLHNVTKKSPIEKPRVEYKWSIDHQENATGTLSQYVPYSTTRQKIKSWQPTSNKT